MSYYTYYSLESNSRLDLEEEVSKLEPTKFEELIYIVTTGDSLNYSSDILEQMAEFSKLHPDTTFKLYGDGEETDDDWLRYYKNGKHHEVPGVIHYAEFDESKLTTD